MRKCKKEKWVFTCVMNTHYGPSGETWKLEKTSRIVAHHVTWPYFSTVSRFKHILIFAYICTSFHRNKDQIRTRNKFRFYMNFQLAISIDPFIKASVTSEYKNFSDGRYLNSAIGGCFCVACFFYGPVHIIMFRGLFVCFYDFLRNLTLWYAAIHCLFFNITVSIGFAHFQFINKQPLCSVSKSDFFHFFFNG